VDEVIVEKLRENRELFDQEFVDSVYRSTKNSYTVSLDRLQ
jgi:hypothetical protein